MVEWMTKVMRWLVGSGGETTTAGGRLATGKSKEIAREGGEIGEKWKRKEEMGVLKCAEAVVLRSSPHGVNLITS